MITFMKSRRRTYYPEAKSTPFVEWVDRSPSSTDFFEPP